MSNYFIEILDKKIFFSFNIANIYFQYYELTLKMNILCGFLLQTLIAHECVNYYLIV